MRSDCELWPEFFLLLLYSAMARGRKEFLYLPLTAELQQDLEELMWSVMYTDIIFLELMYDLKAYFQIFLSILILI